MAKNVQASIFAALVLATAPLLANGASYNYIEGGYSVLDVDLPGTSNEDGWFAAGSFSLTDSFYLTGGYERWSLPVTNFNISQVNLGYRLPISPVADFNAELGWTRLSAGSLNDEDAARATAGVRGRLARFFEARAYAGYLTDFDEGDFILGVQGNILFSQNFALTLQAETYDFDVNVGRIGLRIMF